MAVIPLRKASKMWDKRIKALKKAQKKTPLVAGKFMEATAKKLAPVATGELLRGIRKRKKGRGWVVESRVRGRFKHNLFANQTAPYRTLRFRKNSRQPFFATPQNVVYGRGAKTVGGKTVRWSGKARFWHFASLRTRALYPKLVRKNTRKALRITA